MTNGTPKIVSTKQMEIIFRHRDVDSASECLIISKKSLDSNQPSHVDTQSLLRKHDRVFAEIPLGRPPDRGFEYTIECVKGKKNIVVDALSKKPVVCSLTEVSTDCKSHLLVDYSKNKFACELMDGHI